MAFETEIEDPRESEVVDLRALIESRGWTRLLQWMETKNQEDGDVALGVIDANDYQRAHTAGQIVARRDIITFAENRGRGFESDGSEDDLEDENFDLE